ncbi:nuclear transport factor 2 family protein [Ferruginibacter sp.]|nr:nuclear transport factor 2 family protein [Ferruginibacter sp.]
MKNLVTILCLLFFVGAFAQTTDEEKLTATVKEFHQALVKKNTISLNQQTDKALSYGHSNGWVQSKKDLVKDFERGYISYQSFKEDSITVLMNDNMANVRFVADITATLGGTTVVNNYHLKVLEVWVKKGKRWVLFARQAVK